jgi:iron complex outermembrane recepter protein
MTRTQIQRTSTSWLALSFASAAIGLSAPTAIAQAAASADQADGNRAIVVVTAQRREEDLQEVPLSVTAVSGETLEERNIVDVSRLDVVTPGFTYGRSGIDSRPAMRGVRTENVGVNGDTTIGYFIDGIYQSRAAQASAAFVDVERVEVQRGPQGTLYGRNTFGGNISVVTNAPDLDRESFAANLQYGSFETGRFDGFVNAPLGDKAAVRLAGGFVRGGGYVENAFNDDAELFDQDSSYLRGSLKLEPTDNLEVTLRADYLKQAGNGGSAFGYKLIGSYYNPTVGAAVFNSTPLFLNTRPNNRDGIDDNPSLAGVQDLGIPIFAKDDPYKVDTDLVSFLDLERVGYTGEVVWDLGAITLKSITGYVDFETERTSDTDFSRNTLGVDYQLTASESLSQEVQMLSDFSGPFQFVAGAYYFKDDLKGVFINQQLSPVLNGVVANGGVPFGGSFYDDQVSHVISTAFYGQAELNLSEQFKLTAGVRYTEDDKRFRVNRPVAQSAANVIGVVIRNPVPFDFDPGAGVDTELQETFDKTTWRVGADYRLTPDNLVYASAATGFRSGGFNTQTAAQIQTFAPEEVTAYEIGSKNFFPGSNFTVNLAAFFNQYQDLQEQRQVPVGSTTASIIFNAAEAEAYGLEAEAMWTPTEALSLGGTLSILNAEYTDFPDAPLPGGFANPVSGLNTINPALLPPGFNCRIVPNSQTPGTPNGVLGCNLSGNKIPYSPEYSGTVYGSYEFALPGGGTLTPFAAVTYSAEFFGQPFNTQLERTDAFARVDLSVEWAPSETVSIRAFVDNATNEEVLNRTVYGGGGALQGSWQPPRTWGIRIGVKN